MVGLFKKVLRPFIFIFLFVLLIGVFGLFIASVVGAFFFLPASPFFIPGHSIMGYMVSISGFLTLSIPLLALFYFASRYIRPYNINFHARRNLRYVWFAALSFTIYGIIDTIADFRTQNKDFSFESYEVNADTLRFNVTDPVGYYHGWYHIGSLRYTGTEMYNDNYRVVLKKSDSPQLRIERTVVASGSSPKNALLRAKEINHQITFDGEEIKIPSRASWQKGEKIRDQFVDYVIYVPEGKEVIFDNRSRGDRFILDFDDNYDVPHNYQKYSWTMGKTGFTSKSWEEVSNFRRSVQLNNPLVININSDFEVDIVKGEENEMIIVGHKNEVEKITVVQQEDILTIVNEGGRLQYPVKVYIRVPKVETFSTRTDEKVRFEGFKQNAMEILLTGEAELNAYLDIGNLTIQSDKNNTINLTGKGDVLNLAIGYYSEFNAENYAVAKLNLKSQLRRAKVKVENLIRAERQINNSFKIFGDPKIEIGEIKEEIESIKEEVKEELIEEE
jgi:hypothetical protein